MRKIGNKQLITKYDALTSEINCLNIILEMPNITKEKRKEIAHQASVCWVRRKSIKREIIQRFRILHDTI